MARTLAHAAGRAGSDVRVSRRSSPATSGTMASRTRWSEFFEHWSDGMHRIGKNVKELGDRLQLAADAYDEVECSIVDQARGVGTRYHGGEPRRRARDGRRSVGRHAGRAATAAPGRRRQPAARAVQGRPAPGHLDRRRRGRLRPRPAGHSPRSGEGAPLLVDLRSGAAAVRGRVAGRPRGGAHARAALHRGARPPHRRPFGSRPPASRPEVREVGALRRRRSLRPIAGGSQDRDRERRGLGGGAAGRRGRRRAAHRRLGNPGCAERLRGRSAQVPRQAPARLGTRDSATTRGRGSTAGPTTRSSRSSFRPSPVSPS